MSQLHAHRHCNHGCLTTAVAIPNATPTRIVEGRSSLPVSFFYVPLKRSWGAIEARVLSFVPVMMSTEERALRGASRPPRRMPKSPTHPSKFRIPDLPCHPGSRSPLLPKYKYNRTPAGNPKCMQASLAHSRSKSMGCHTPSNSTFRVGKAGQTPKDAIVASLAHRSRRQLRVCLQIAVVQSELTLKQGEKKRSMSARPSSVSAWWETG